MLLKDYSLHRLGWKAFQDLCIAIVEERLERPVQTFLPSQDAGRDGAFLGTWDSFAGESTIQCKFTSKSDRNLTLSMLSEELPKARRLAKNGLASDYIILTNYSITGASELKIRGAFQKAGVGRCRIFHRDWIIGRIQESARLRMMMPRLYGLVDLDRLLDDRAYEQAQLILSEMGDNLQKLVVTEAHRKSVRAISNYNLVLLLGSPAAGKSTIGASLALGASDIWRSSTIKSISPDHLQRHLDPKGGQFFWVDDAWGSTQYQRDRTEGWNQVFPLMQGAMKQGTRFLITSRDYIWNEARRELKIQALPVLSKSQVIINVHELTLQEKARILYNHLKLGDQPVHFRRTVKAFLPKLATRDDFLPESARRLGTEIFTSDLIASEDGVADFFERPKEFLEQTIENLSAQSRAAIALVFLNGGKVRSPVPVEMLSQPASAFGATVASVRTQLEALNGSLLNLAKDEIGAFWTYRHPTISDAFASYLARSPEMVEIYLRGARPESIIREVVCAGIERAGAFLIVPDSLHSLLADRIAGLGTMSLGSFISYRSNKIFTKLLLRLRPEIWERLNMIVRPLKDDIDVDLVTALHEQGLLSEKRRRAFVKEVRAAAVEEADDSFLESEAIGNVLTGAERESILRAVERTVLRLLDRQVDRLSSQWGKEYEPNDYFESFRAAVTRFASAIGGIASGEVLASAERHIRVAVDRMSERYDPDAAKAEPVQQSPARASSLDDLFRDVDD